MHNDDVLNAMMKLATEAGTDLQTMQRAFSKLDATQLLTLQSMLNARVKQAIKEGRLG